MPGGPGSFTSDSTSLMLIWRAHGNGDLSMSHTGLSPSMVRLSRLFRYRWFCNPSVLPQPRDESRFGLCSLSLAATYEINVFFFSSRYLDVSVPWVRSIWLMHSARSDGVLSSTRFPDSDISGSTLVCQFPGAFRRLPRLSSPLDAKTSTMYP